MTFALAGAAVPTAALGATYSNPTPITIPDEGAGSPYPSQITVTGASGVVTKARATLTNFSHTSPDEVEILLVAPDGRATLLLSDSCANPPATTGQTFTFDDAAASTLPGSGPCLSGTYKPTRNPSHPFTVFPAPAPGGPQSTAFLGALNGAPANGAWQLFVLDDSSADVGNIAGGWTLELQTTPPETKIGGKKIKGSTAKFTFSSSDPGLSFQCKLDKRKYKPCKSPKKYKNLSGGTHKFRVRAVDAAGVVDPTPAKKKFTI